MNAIIDRTVQVAPARSSTGARSDHRSPVVAQLSTSLKHRHFGRLHQTRRRVGLTVRDEARALIGP